MCVSILLFCICLVSSCICSDLCRSGLCRIPRVTRQLRCKRSIFKDPQTMSKVPSFTFLCISVRTMELYKINVYFVKKCSIFKDLRRCQKCSLKDPKIMSKVSHTYLGHGKNTITQKGEHY